MKQRNRFVDLARSLAIVNMVAYHFCYDWFVVCGRDVYWYSYWYIHLWQQAICWTFILVSGISWHFGGGNLRKGLKLNLGGLWVTAVTVAFMPGQAIWFGILSFLGCAVWLLQLLEKALRKCPPLPGIVLSFFCFAATYHLQLRVVGFGPFTAAVPEALYAFKPMVILGLPYPGFWSSDYFPMMPWFFLFLCGYYLWRMPAFRQKTAALALPDTSAFSSRSFLIYLLHQPLCMAAAVVLSYIA